MPRTKRDKPDFKLTRIKGKPNWYITWTWNRKPERISTGTESQTEAQTKLSQFITGWAAPDEDKGVTVGYAIESYLEYKKPDMPTRNYKALEYVLGKVKQSFGSELPVKSINRAFIKSKIVQWQANGFKPGTINKRLSIFTASLNHVRKEGYLDTVPHIDKLPAPPARDKWANPNQVRDFIDSITQPHIKLFALLAAHTLSRKQAILDLTWDRVDLKANKIDFNVPGRVRTGKRRVEVPIVSKELKNALKTAKRYKSTNHVIEYNGKGDISISVGFRRAATRVKMAWLTPHILRHSGCCALAQKGMSLIDIAGLMGDSVTTVQKHYLKHSPDHLRKATAELGKIYA